MTDRPKIAVAYQPKPYTHELPRFCTQNGVLHRLSCDRIQSGVETHCYTPSNARTLLNNKDARACGCVIR